MPDSLKPVRIVFLDRDGVINRALERDSKPYPPRNLSEFEILPEVPSACAKLKAAGFRVETDARNEKMNAKIRDFANQKTPYILVFGDKEEATGSVSVRTRGKGDQGSQPLDDFIAGARALVASQSTGL